MAKLLLFQLHTYGDAVDKASGRYMLALTPKLVNLIFGHKTYMSGDEMHFHVSVVALFIYLDVYLYRISLWDTTSILPFGVLLG